MSEREQLEQAIAALEAQRAILGDAVVDAALASMREKLAALTAAQSSTQQQRKQATIVFADLSGFTQLTETMDPEEITELVNGLWQRLDGVIVSHGGVIDKHIGDAVMAEWGLPVSRENDPEQAIRAALAMQTEIQTWKQQALTSAPLDNRVAPIAMRIGINTGPVLLGQVGTKHEFTAMGDAVNMASRLEQAAPLNGILISHETYRHVRGIFDVQALAPITVKGKTEPVQVYIVHRAKPRSFHVPGRGLEGIEHRMIGREAELRTLQHAFETAVEDHDVQVVTVFGEAGVGKTRLLSEFEHWLDIDEREIWYFKGRADAGMQSRPYALLRDVFTFRFEIRDSDPLAVAQEKLEQGVVTYLAPAATPVPGEQTQTAREKAHFIGHLLGFDFSASVFLAPVLHNSAQVQQQALFYLSEFFRAVTREHPTVILLEDIHWSDDNSLDAFDYLGRELRARRGVRGYERGAPALVVALARNALFERRPLWGEGEAFHTRLALRPLDKRSSQQLVNEILRQVDHIPTELRETIVAGAEGNPFYLEEIIKMLIEAGVIVTQADQWQVNLARLRAIHVPPTLTAVLQARLDGLMSEERDTLKRASVVGQIFWDAVVAELKGRTEAGEPYQVTEETLRQLRQRELVLGREASQFADAREYIFKHAMLRDVAYESVLLRERKALHAQAARWLIERSGDRVDEYAGLIAEHFDRAGEGGQAAIWYSLAGQEAQAVYANEAAIEFYTRALDLLAQAESKMHETLDERERVELLLNLGQVLQMVARLAEAEERVRDALANAERMEDTRLQGKTLRALGNIALRRDDFVQSEEWYEQARAKFAEISATADVSQVLSDIGGSALFRGDLATAAMILEEALRMAREVNDLRGVAWALNDLGLLYLWQGDPDRSRETYTQSLAAKRQIGDKEDVAITLSNLGELALVQGDYTVSRAWLEESLSLRRAIGDQRGSSMSLVNLGHLETVTGHPDLAEVRFKESLPLQYKRQAKLHMSASLIGLARVAEMTGAAERAARLAGATLTLCTEGQFALQLLEKTAYDQATSGARRQLGDAAFEAAFGAGQAMTLDEAVAYALEEQG